LLVLCSVQSVRHSTRQGRLRYARLRDPRARTSGARTFAMWMEVSDRVDSDSCSCMFGLFTAAEAQAISSWHTRWPECTPVPLASHSSSTHAVRSVSHSVSGRLLADAHVTPMRSCTCGGWHAVDWHAVDKACGSMQIQLTLWRPCSVRAGPARVPAAGISLGISPDLRAR